MFSLTIVFGPGPMVWTLLYKSLEKAQEHRSFIESYENTMRIIDDFGQECTIKPEALHGLMVEDLEQSHLAHIERALHQARTQAKGAELADADPTLRQARLKAQGGMPMIQPMPAGFRPNGRFPS